MDGSWRNQAFAGANEELEVESLDEFMSLLKRYEKKDGLHRLQGWVLQEVDLKGFDAGLFATIDWKGSVLMGCELPAWTSEEEVRRRGALVLSNDPDLPFRPFRAFMYSQIELCAHDRAIYEWYLRERGRILPELHMASHDFSIRDALFDFLEGRSVVAVMGGHGMARSGSDYAAVVRICWKLARKGVVVASGGGPGAMEAACMGAALCRKDEATVERALRIVGEDLGFDDEVPEGTPAYADRRPARRVLTAVFGDCADPTSGTPSLAIPTFYYGHEPTNLFAAQVAKFFSNSIREDLLIAIANCGIIFTPGSAGTRQEIAQHACLNHYAAKGTSNPMIFFNYDGFWSGGVKMFDMVSELAKGQEYAQHLLLSANVDEVVDHVIKFRDSVGLPTRTTLEKCWWDRHTSEIDVSK